MIKKFYPVVFTGLLLVFQNKFTPIIIKYFMDSENVGIFAVAIKLASLSSFILVSVNMLISPVISKLYCLNNIFEIEKIYSFSTRIVGFINYIFIGFIIQEKKTRKVHKLI